MPFVNHRCCPNEVEEHSFSVYCDCEHVLLLEPNPEVTLVHIRADREEGACEGELGRPDKGFEGERAVESDVE